MLARMQHNVTAQRRFIADAAHQMRTPLTGLKTQAQLAMRETDPAELRHALRQILNGADRASHLVDQLLALARAEASESLAADAGGARPRSPVTRSG
jgi:two-component system sensor histidine kinase TctE